MKWWKASRVTPMKRLFGSHENKLDAKGRVSVPAAFRNAWKAEPEMTLILRPSLLEGCVEAWPLPDYAKFQEKLDALAESDPEHEALATVVYSEAAEVETDAQGRIMIPAIWRRARTWPMRCISWAGAIIFISGSRRRGGRSSSLLRRGAEIRLRSAGAMTEFSHIPVLRDEAVTMLQPRDGGVYLDGTFGGGGYAKAILDAADCTLFAIDRDPAAVARGRELARAYPGRFEICEGRISNIADLLAARGVSRSMARCSILGFPRTRSTIRRADFLFAMTGL